MPTIIISVLIGLLFIYGIYCYVRKLRHGGGCCGEHEAAVKKVRVSDRNKEHYPYEVILTIDGMTCSNCVRHVENALNGLDGVWAQVDLGSRQATVRMRQAVPEDTLRQAVSEAGYTVLSAEQGKSQG